METPSKNTLAPTMNDPLEKITLPYLAIILLITLAGAAFRIGYLDHPMRYDESLTFLLLGSPALPSFAWMNYFAPNNHLLNSLLMRLTTPLAGTEPWAIRLPAFLAGLAAIPLGSWLARLLTGRRIAGILAAALLSASTMLVEYSVNARGYSMVCLATLLMGIATLNMFRDPAARKWPWIWAIAAALGMFAIPIMLYPIGLFTVILIAQACWTSSSRTAGNAFLLKTGKTLLLAGAMTMMLYAPILFCNDLNSVLGNEFITPRPYAQVLSELPLAARQTLSDWLRDTGALWKGVIGIGLIASLFFALRKRDAFLTMPVLAPLLLAMAAIAHRVVPFPRVWLFLFPLLLVCATAGLTGLLSLLPKPGYQKLLCGLFSLFVFLNAGIGLYSGGEPYLISEDPATLVDAPRIVRDLAPELQGSASVMAWVPGWPSLAYYLQRLDSAHQPAALTDPTCSRVFIVVGNTQTLEEVIQGNRFPTEQFGPPQRWKNYPRSEVFLLERLQAASPPAKSN